MIAHLPVHTFVCVGFCWSADGFRGRACAFPSVKKRSADDDTAGRQRRHLRKKCSDSFHFCYITPPKCVGKPFLSGKERFF